MELPPYHALTCSRSCSTPDAPRRISVPRRENRHHHGDIPRVPQFRRSGRFPATRTTASPSRPRGRAGLAGVRTLGVERQLVCLAALLTGFSRRKRSSERSPRSTKSAISENCGSARGRTSFGTPILQAFQSVPTNLVGVFKGFLDPFHRSPSTPGNGFEAVRRDVQNDAGVLSVMRTKFHLRTLPGVRVPAVRSAVCSCVAAPARRSAKSARSTEFSHGVPDASAGASRRCSSR